MGEETSCNMLRSLVSWFDPVSESKKSDARLELPTGPKLDGPSPLNILSPGTRGSISETNLHTKLSDFGRPHTDSGMFVMVYANMKNDSSYKKFN